MLTCFYMSLIIIGGGYIALTFIIGELFDFGGDIGHAIDGASDSAAEALGGLGGVLDGVFGGADAADVDIGAIEHEIEGVGPSPFSLRTVAMFAAGFGAGGLIGEGLGLPDQLTLIPAGGVGLVTSATMWLFLRFLYAEQGSTSIQATDYLGLIGRVTITIPERKPGQVALVVRGQRMNVPARSEDSSSIPAQTQVEVVSMEGGMVIVQESR